MLTTITRKISEENFDPAPREMKYSIRSLIILTAIVAVVAALISSLGIEVGIMALFLGVANISILSRLFFSKKPFTETEIGWLMLAWLVVGSLTIVMLYDFFFTHSHVFR